MSDNAAMEVFFEIHQGNLQEGPGDSASTKKAFAMIPGLPESPAILDAGCGPGRQTLDLCRLAAGSITAVDNHPPYLEALSSRIGAAGHGGRVRTLEADMAALPFDPASFDLIWSEGAIYNIGFRNGLEQWRPLLKPDGCIAVTELTLLQDDLPDEVAAFWKEAYPAAQPVSDNLSDLQAAGYRLLGQFALPESSWWEYYDPIRSKLPKLEATYADSPEALEVLAMERSEIDMYRRFSRYYGYQFYIGQKHV